MKIVIDYCKENNYTHTAYNPTTLGTELQEYVDYGCILKKRTNACIVYQFDVLKFNDYIKQHSFNLDEVEEMNSIEQILLQIDEHKKIISYLKEKFIKQCDVQMGKDPLEEGIDKKIQQVATIKDCHSVDKFKKRLLPTQPIESCLSQLDRTIFTMAFD